MRTRKAFLRKQTLSKYYKVASLFWLLQKKSSVSTKNISKTKPKLEKEKIDFNRIRCPWCEWKPNASSRWLCSSCEHPENFLAGCGMVWNTFMTRGLCPRCNHQWTWTSCLSCQQWSLHETWYVKESTE